MDEPGYTQQQNMGWSGWSDFLSPPTQTSDPGEVPGNINPSEMKRVYNLIDRLRRHSEIKQIAEAFLARDVSELPSLRPIIASLTRPNRYRWRERQTAVWILGSARITPQQRRFAIDALIELLEGRLEPDFSDRARTQFRRSLPLAFILSLPGLSEDDPPYPAIVAMTFLILFTTLLVSSRIADRNASSYIRAEAAIALGKLRAVKSLDALVAASQNNRAFSPTGWRVANAALSALPAVLMSVTQQHEGQFRSDTIAGLCRLLNNCDESLAVAILHAFAYIGNTPALNEVLKLAGGRGRAAKESRVQIAAQSCLPLLQARVNRERDPQILLRASSVSPTIPDQLLRPAMETKVTDPLQMLRASADPDWKGSEPEIALVLQILQNIQQVGDTRALPYVEQIADLPDADRRLRLAAQACLPALHAHVELERFSPSQSTQIDLQTNSAGI